MAIFNSALQYRKTIYYQTNTTNISFVKMYNIMEILGIKNNKFFLALYDKHLMDVDPFDEENLDLETKVRIAQEVKRNYWYFIRECVRIPESGGKVRYTLHRGNLAMGFCFTNNLNVYIELPRQNFKTISAVCFYLWVYNFATENTQMMFMNKKHEDSKLNLKRLKDIKDALPSYLQFNEVYNDKGKIIRTTDTVESVTHAKLNNTIVTKPGAKSKAAADGIGRGCTQALQW